MRCVWKDDGHLRHWRRAVATCYEQPGSLMHEYAPVWWREQFHGRCRAFWRGSYRCQQAVGWHMYVRTPRNVHLCSANKRLDLEAPIFESLSRLTRYVRNQIFFQIGNVLDLPFQARIFESSTMDRSHVIISQTVTDLASIAIAKKQKDAHGLSNDIFTFVLGPFSRSRTMSSIFRRWISQKR